MKVAFSFLAIFCIASCCFVFAQKERKPDKKTLYFNSLYQMTDSNNTDIRFTMEWFRKEKSRRTLPAKYEVFREDGIKLLSGFMLNGTLEEPQYITWDSAGRQTKFLVEDNNGEVIKVVYDYGEGDSLVLFLDEKGRVVLEKAYEADWFHRMEIIHPDAELDTVIHYFRNGQIEMLQKRFRNKIPVDDGSLQVQLEDAVRYSIKACWDIDGNPVFSGGKGKHITYYKVQSDDNTSNDKKPSPQFIRTVKDWYYHGPYCYFDQNGDSLFSGIYLADKISDTIWVHGDNASKATMLDLSKNDRKVVFLEKYEEKHPAFTYVFYEDLKVENMQEIGKLIQDDYWELAISGDAVSVQAQFDQNGDCIEHYPIKITSLFFLRAIGKHIRKLRIKTRPERISPPRIQRINIPFQVQ